MSARDLVLGVAAMLLLVGAGWDEPALAGEIEISGMTFVANRDSSNELVVWAEKASVDVDAQIAHLEQIHVTIPTGASRLAIELRCARGEVDLSTNDFRLSGDVRGRTQDGRRFQTEWIGYDDSEALLYTDAPVLIHEQGGRYEGGSLRYEVGARRFRLLGGARVVRVP